MTNLNNADKIGYSRDGAVVLREEYPFLVVRCKCGAEFKCGRAKARDTAWSTLHCNACRHKRLSEAGRKSVGLPPK